ncbi:MAG: CHAD domain-containing protein [Gammaproteobacteria bacterium]|jgi:CHAD domain-containing protein|nr:CHAD domain-containing protein [Gammaproteobacteria bacterium]
MQKAYHFALPGQSGSEALGTALRHAGFAFRRHPISLLQRVYYDTFDWRLYAAGLLLLSEEGGEGLRLRLRERNSGLDVVVIDVVDVPRFAENLPQGVMRKRLAPLIEERRLLPLVSLENRGDEFRVLDGQSKIVMRAAIERYRVDGGDGRVRLRSRIAVVPVRGFAEPLAKVLPALEHDLQLKQIDGGVLEEALDAIGRRPLDYRARPDLRLKRGEPIGEAARRVFVHLLDVVEANEDGVRQETDAGFLHDLRVAVRRTRSLLSELKRILSAPHFGHYRAEFAWLSRLTGPVRDLDVHLAAFHRYERWLGGSGPELESLRAALRKRRTGERRAMLEGLASPQYRSLKKGWRSVLDEADERWRSGDAGVPADETVRELVQRRHERVLARGRKLDRDSEDEDFHSLRKQVKKLRYLIELFPGAMHAGEARAMLDDLKSMQKLLGRHHDFSVKLSVMRELKKSFREQGRGDVAAAAKSLCERLQDGKREAEQEFIRLFDRMAADGVGKKARRRAGKIRESSQ